jgi:hypothetical protein
VLVSKRWPSAVSADFVMSQLAQNEILENALRKRVKLLPNDNL